jgi:hypothetical protein
MDSTNRKMLLQQLPRIAQTFSFQRLADAAHVGAPRYVVGRQVDLPSIKYGRIHWRKSALERRRAAAS